MNEQKWFTCLTEKCSKVEGAIEGTKRQALAWMKRTISGLRKAEDQEVGTIWYFFREGEAVVYNTQAGENVYLAESFFEVAPAEG